MEEIKTAILEKVNVTGGKALAENVDGNVEAESE